MLLHFTSDPLSKYIMKSECPYAVKECSKANVVW